MTESELQRVLTEKLIVIYDGGCGFCNSSVRFILDQRPRDVIRFISQESDLGKKLIQKHTEIDGLNSIVVLDNLQYFTKSTAVFKILFQVRSTWRHLSLLQYIPTSICDFFYDLIAKNRHRFKEKQCQINSPEERAYFI